MIKIVCDNCGKELRDKPTQLQNDKDFKPEKRVTLRMHIEGTSTYPIDMDLCVSCAKKYVVALKDPV